MRRAGIRHGNTERGFVKMKAKKEQQKVKTGGKISKSARLYYWGTNSTSYGTF